MLFIFRMRANTRLPPDHCLPTWSKASACASQLSANFWLGAADMGNVSADGKQLWLSGRYDDVVYVFDTASGAVQKIPVGKEPHGLAVSPPS